MEREAATLGSPDFLPTAESLKGFTESLGNYRSNLRKGSYNEFEENFYTMLERTVEGMVQCKSVEDVARRGFADLLEPLEKACAAHGTKRSDELKAKMKSWYADMKAAFAEDAFKKEIWSAKTSGKVDWPAFQKCLKDCHGSVLGADVSKHVGEAMGILFSNLHQKARPKQKLS